MITKCPYCQKKLEIEDNLSGNQVRCANPQCQNVFTAPTVAGTKSVSKFRTRIPLILSVIAAILSATALFVSLYMDPLLGKGLSSYDFTSPQKALRSQLEMEINKDLRAMLELGKLRSVKYNREKLETIRVHDEAEYQGKKLLFVSFKKNSILQYDMAAFEKDAECGLWFRSYVLTSSMEDEGLKAKIEKWENRKPDDAPEE